MLSVLTNPLIWLGPLSPPSLFCPCISPFSSNFDLLQREVEIVRVRRLISDISAEAALALTPRVHDSSIVTSDGPLGLDPEQMRVLLQVESLSLLAIIMLV